MTSRRNAENYQPTTPNAIGTCMKYWIRLLALVGCVLLIFALIGSVLPHDYSLSATTEINAPPAEVYDRIDSLPDWKAWSQWDPDSIEDLTVNYGADGKSQTWTDVRGEGKLWFTDQKQNERIDFRLRFANFPEMTSSLVLTPSDDTTTVTWSSEGVLPSGPFYGFFRHIFASGMTRQYEQSLGKLKKIVEKVEEPAVEEPAESVPPPPESAQQE